MIDVIIEFIIIITIILSRVSLLLMIWSSVNIVFYLFRYNFFLLNTPRVVKHAPYLTYKYKNKDAHDISGENATFPIESKNRVGGSITELILVLLARFDGEGDKKIDVM